MFHIGEYVVYGNRGVCKIVNIKALNEVESPKLYYELIPESDTNGKVFTPAEDQNLKIRQMITKEEAFRLIDEIPYFETLKIENDKEREQKYKEALNTRDCKEWIKIIRTLYKRRMLRSQDGKKLTGVDEKYLKAAQNYLYTELTLQTGISKEKVEECFITSVELQS